MDIQKERESFEAYMAEKYKNLMDRRQCLNNGDGYMAWDMNVAWQVWQAAKAQAVPEPSIDLTGHDIKYITNFMCYEDQDNLDTEVTIQKCKSGFEGAGLYAWVAEYPEEGGIKISANSQEQNQ